jgi:molecular chaperone GrpE
LDLLLAARAAGRRKAVQRPKTKPGEPRKIAQSSPPPSPSHAAPTHHGETVPVPNPAPIPNPEPVFLIPPEDPVTTQGLPPAPAPAPVAEEAPVAEAAPAPAAVAEVAEVAPAISSQELNTLRAKLQKTEETSKQTYDRLVRATADLENLKKRAKREVEDARSESKGKIIKEILPVFDNLERALAHADKTGDDAKGMREGVDLVCRQFQQSLERIGVRVIEVMHTPFDPNLHEAVGQQDSADHPPGTVVEVFQKGYMMGERLLRPALVVVSKSPSETKTEDPAPPSESGNEGA